MLSSMANIPASSVFVSHRYRFLGVFRFLDFLLCTWSSVSFHRYLFPPFPPFERSHVQPTEPPKGLGFSPQKHPQKVGYLMGHCTALQIVCPILLRVPTQHTIKPYPQVDEDPPVPAYRTAHLDGRYLTPRPAKKMDFVNPGLGTTLPMNLLHKLSRPSIGTRN